VLRREIHPQRLVIK